MSDVGSSTPRDRGRVLGIGVHFVLLFAVGAMSVFLASRYRFRFDLTADDLYTLTPSTQRVLERVEQRLRIEAYFSPDDELATVNREGRRTLRNVLDEFVQQGRGRVVVQYFDPQSDTELRKKAERLGIKPQRVQDLEGTTLSNKEVWQGLRFLLGGDRQKVVPMLGFTDQPWKYEAALTPLVKALTVAERPKIGVAAWPGTPAESVGPARQEQPRGFGRLLGIPELTDRYDFVDFDLGVGDLLPEDIGVLVLLRPRDLADRAKYVVDQFLMRGGQLVVFADTDDVSLGQGRTLQTQRVPWDAPDSTLGFVDQLAGYGAVVRDRMLVDWLSTPVPFGAPVSMQVGGQVMQTVQPLQLYPYWFMPTATDWAERAEGLARRDDGSVDESLVASYRQRFRPGVEPELAKGLTPPAFFWPCGLDLAEVLPEGVTGDVLMRSSPRTVLQTPPRTLDPVGRDPRRYQATYNRFATDLAQLIQSEPPQQHALLVELRGRFRSAFAGRAVPAAPGAVVPPSEPSPDPLAEPVGTEPGRSGDEVGPVVPGADPSRSDGPGDLPLIDEAREGARLVVVADATFLRDDLVGGEYQQVGGPVSAVGPMFFANLLDWLAADRDLFELRMRGFGVDRRLQMVDEEDRAGMPPERLQQEVDRRTARVRYWAVALPVKLLLLLGAGVLFARHAQKRRFLAAVQSRGSANP
ncbi:MAG: GldG family protein [Planctomycetota bacterium]|nr:GldG family protein [Planctomycetota bacterium]